jgi:hypothetical protein
VKHLTLPFIRIKVYLIEVENSGKRNLSDFAFRRLVDLGLAKSAASIKEGDNEMTSAQHKARGVLYVTQVSSVVCCDICFTMWSSSPCTRRPFGIIRH